MRVACAYNNVAEDGKTLEPRAVLFFLHDTLVAPQREAVFRLLPARARHIDSAEQAAVRLWTDSSACAGKTSEGCCYSHIASEHENVLQVGWNLHACHRRPSAGKECCSTADCEAPSRWIRQLFRLRAIDSPLQCQCSTAGTNAFPCVPDADMAVRSWAKARACMHAAVHKHLVRWSGV